MLGLWKKRTSAFTPSTVALLHGSEGIVIPVGYPISKLLLPQRIEDHDDFDFGVELDGERFDGAIEHKERVLGLCGAAKKNGLLANHLAKLSNKLPGTLINTRQSIVGGFACPPAFPRPKAGPGNGSRIE
jgi:hypothetical protein